MGETIDRNHVDDDVEGMDIGLERRARATRKNKNDRIFQCRGRGELGLES